MRVKINKQLIPIIGGLFHKYPKYHRESYILNLLGYQLLRILFFKTKLNLRKLLLNKSVDSNLNSLGYYTKENMLSHELFSEIQSYVQKLLAKEKGRECYPDSFGNFSFLRWDLNLSKDLEQRVFRELGDLTGIVSAYLGTNKKFVPTFSILGLSKITADQDDSDIENIAHADTFFNTIKAFIYLSDVNNANGPYTYYEGR